MNIMNTLCLGGLFALTSFLALPMKADEWNKRTEFQFSAPVQIPGKVLAAGKYVFQLMDSDSDRNVVEIFSENSDGKESLVATLIAIRDYMLHTPDEPVVHFEERPSGMPEAIHSWFYPGENTGWEFMYPKGETLGRSVNTMPVAAPLATASTPILQEPPDLKEPESTPAEVAAVEEEIMVAQNDAPPAPAAQEPAVLPTPEADAQSGADRLLPETAGHSGLELMIGLAMLGGGLATVFAARRKAVA
jgi:hypothetical protein